MAMAAESTRGRMAPYQRTSPSVRAANAAAGRSKTASTTASGLLKGAVASDTSSNAASTISVEQISCLIVEDNEINQRVAQSFLRRLGLTSIDVASNGEQALLRARERHYDIILMDIMMPIMDGIESTRCIRSETGPNQNTVIVAVSAMGAHNLSLVDTGITDFLSKPFTKNELQEMMVKWVVTPNAALPLERPVETPVSRTSPEVSTSEDAERSPAA